MAKQIRVCCLNCQNCFKRNPTEVESLNGNKVIYECHADAYNYVQLKKSSIKVLHKSKTACSDFIRCNKDVKYNNNVAVRDCTNCKSFDGLTCKDEKFAANYDKHCGEINRCKGYETKITDKLSEHRKTMQKYDNVTPTAEQHDVEKQELKNGFEASLVTIKQLTDALNRANITISERDCKISRLEDKNKELQKQFKDVCNRAYSMQQELDNMKSCLASAEYTQTTVLNQSSGRIDTIYSAMPDEYKKAEHSDSIDEKADCVCEFCNDKFCNCINTAREESVYHEASYCEDNKNCYYKQLQTAKEENEKLTQQNKQLREALEKIYTMCQEQITKYHTHRVNFDKHDLFYILRDIQIIKVQALKGVE